MRKAIKVVNIVLIIAILMMIFSTTVMAADSVIDKLNPNYTEDDGGLTTVGQKIISYISIAAIVVAVIVLLILGIKYMIGSASEKAEYKKTMIPYLVGAILVFGAGAIAQVIVQVATNLTAE